MRTISVGQLRQNPTEALRAVELEGAEYAVTNHRRTVARLLPPQSASWVDGERAAALLADLGTDAAWAAEHEARDGDRLEDEPRR